MTHSKLLILGIMAASAITAGAFTPTRTAMPAQPQPLRPKAPLPTALRPLALTPVTDVAATADADDEGTLLFSMHPTSEEFSQCTVIDANDDGRTIEYFHNDVADWPIYYNNNMAQVPADDWLITPAVKLTDANIFYRLQVEAQNNASFRTERFEIKIGKAPTIEAMTITAMQELVPNMSWEPFSGTFGIDEPGDYYIGIHVCSDPSPTAFRLMMRDLKLTTTTATALTPGAVTDITVTPHPQGELTATVSFKLPTTAVNGSPLPASDLIHVTLTSPAGTAETSGHPGDLKELQVSVVNGTNTFTLTSTSDSGQQGGTIKVSELCGVDLPANPVVTYTISPDNLTAIATWQPVTVGANGGIVNPSTTTYNVYTYVTQTQGETTTGMWQPLESGLTECTYSYTVAANAPQDTHELLITTKNEIGESDGGEESYLAPLLGKPYSLPMGEDFSAYAITMSGYDTKGDIADDGQNTVKWGWATASSIDENAGSIGALIGYSHVYEAAAGSIGLPRFNTATLQNAEISITAFMAPATAQSELHIATVDGLTDRLIATITPPSSTMGWTTMSWPVPDEFCGPGTAYAYISSSFPTVVNYFMVSAFSIYNKEALDLALTALTPDDDITVGTPATITATVRNNGYETASVASVTATLTDVTAQPIATVTLTGATSTLAPGQEAEFTGTFTLNKMEHAGTTITATATVTASGTDLNTNNNSAVTTFTLNSINAPVVTDLTGTLNATANGIDLTWTNPVEGHRIESFETTTHGECGAKLAGWTNIDFDRKQEYGMADVALPNGGTAKAFQALSAAELNRALGSEGYAAHSGDRFLITFSAAEAQSDDWLISPEIDPDGGFGFWAGIFDPSFPETFEVMYSTTDPDMDSFQLLESVTKDTNTWEPFIYTELPAGTRYVAIHYCSTDMFALLIDDIAYTPASSDFTVQSYTIYRNGTAIANGITSTTYTDVTPDAATAAYNVAIVATDSEGNTREYPLGNTFCLATSAITDVTATDLSPDTEIYTLQGYRVAAPTTPGLYIIRRGGTATTLLLR